MPHRVVFLCVDRFQLIDLAGPMEVFDTANRVRGDAPFYEMTVASVNGGPLRSSSGLTIETVRADRLSGNVDTFIVAGSFAARSALIEPDFAGQCSVLAGRAARVVCVCNGAFSLAAAGLLDGRRVTSH